VFQQWPFLWYHCCICCSFQEKSSQFLCAVIIKEATRWCACDVWTPSEFHCTPKSTHFPSCLFHSRVYHPRLLDLLILMTVDKAPCYVLGWTESSCVFEEMALFWSA
jgi:hypothetical protein